MVSPFDLELDSQGTIVAVVGSETDDLTGLLDCVGRSLSEIIQLTGAEPSDATGGAQILVTDAESDPIVVRLRVADLLPSRFYLRIRRRLGRDRMLLGFYVRFTPVLTEPASVEPETLQSLSQTMLNSSVDCIKVLDLDERLLMVNAPGLCALEVEDPHTVLGQTWSQLWPDAARDIVQNGFHAAAAGHVSRFRGYCPTAKGSPRWWEVIVAPILSLQGEPVRILAISRDVTREQLQAQNMQETEDRFETLANCMSQLAWMADERGDIFWYNRRWYEYTGATPAEMMGWGWQKVHHPDHVERVVEKIRHAFQHGLDWEDTFPLRGADGEYRWFLSRMMAVRNAEGAIVRWFGTNTDITDRLQTEENLKRSEQKTQLGAALGLLGLAEVDYRTGRVELTPTAAEILGLPPGTLQCARKELNQRCHPADFPRVQTAISSAILTGQDYYADEHRIVLETGEERWVNIRKHFFYEHGGGQKKIAYSLLAARDTTAERAFQAELVEARRQADIANRAKTDFLANMSHEIRTPMTAIMGYAELLQPANADERTKIETILRNGKHLLTLLNDILDLSKVEAGKLEVEAIPVDLRELVDEVVSLLHVRAVEKSLQLRSCIANEVPRRILSDPVRLRQILLNLVGNAIKFTEQGSVDIEITYDQQLGELRCAVIDTGCGINAQEMPKLFLPFGQGDSSVSRNYGGSGLGLVISKRLAELLNGTIDVASVPAEGSRFTLILRRVRPSEHQPGEPSPENDFGGEKLGARTISSAGMLSNYRILIVDDRRDIRFLAAEFVQQAGGEVVTAEDGRAALDLLAERQHSSHGFDLLVMDVQMPKMDGITAIREVRRNGFRLPAIALTANATSEERQACLAAGYNEFITKPIQWENLVQLMNRLLKNS